jgi:hypothetical protein
MKILWVLIVALAVVASAAGAKDSETLAKYEGYRFDIDGSLFLKGELVRTFAAENADSFTNRAGFSPQGRYLAFSFESQSGGEGLYVYDTRRDRVRKHLAGESKIAKFEWFEYAGEIFIIYSTDFSSDENPVLFVVDPSTALPIFHREGWVYGQPQSAVKGIAYYQYTTPDVPLRANMLGYDELFTEMLKGMSQPAGGGDNSESFIFAPGGAKKMIEARSREVVDLLVGSDFEKFSAAVHPEAGLRISIDGHVNEEVDLLFTRDQVRSAEGDKTELLLGTADGTGDPVYKTLAGHLRYLGDLDYKNADAMSYNRVIGRGNTINNVFEYFPQAIVVEYYWAGSEKYGGMDWHSVRLVYSGGADGWFLIGIIEDSWTI